MDEIARYNYRRWQALVKANAVFTRPLLDLTPADAREIVDPYHMLGELAGRAVLCLAGGGGQQSVAFALLGAQVTVVDLSTAQLDRDREAAAHYGLTIAEIEADMRDLSVLDADSFDIVYQPYSLNFVPDVREVFAQVARVLKPGGSYFFNCANPFTLGLQASDWDGWGYPLRYPYLEGGAITSQDEPWVFRGERQVEPIAGPREYRHALSTLVNGLIAAGFTLARLEEEYLGTPDPHAEPGTTEHFTSVAPPWLRFWAAYRPADAAAH
jgi:SAM-dependent methyltransferase